MITFFVHHDGVTRRQATLDAAWRSTAGVVVWADVHEPSAEDAEHLRHLFGFHPLSLEDALQASQAPKVETYGDYLYVVLHGIDFRQEQHAFVTLDVDFFLGDRFLVTVHDGRRRSVAEVADICERNGRVMAEGPAAVMHRIVDSLVGHYRPEVDELEDWLDDLERRVVSRRRHGLTAEILAIKRDISALRRVVIPQRDVLARLARREFDFIDQERAYRFRDVYDQLVRLTDEAIMFQDRVTGILDAHLASVSNQLAGVSKVLAALAVILGPLTVVTGIFGMNVPLPALPGGANAQFWWIMGAMTVLAAGTYAVFRRKGWL